MPRRTAAVKPARSCLHRRPSSTSTLLVACRARMRRRCFRVFPVVLGGWAALATSGYRGWPRGVGAIELTIDPDMVQNMQSANETAATFSSTDYVDLTCKVCIFSLFVFTQQYSTTPYNSSRRHPRIGCRRTRVANCSFSSPSECGAVYCLARVSWIAASK